MPSLPSVPCSSCFYSVATHPAAVAGKIKNDIAADNTDGDDYDSMRSAVTAVAAAASV